MAAQMRSIWLLRKVSLLCLSRLASSDCAMWLSVGYIYHSVSAADRSTYVHTDRCSSVCMCNVWPDGFLLPLGIPACPWPGIYDHGMSQYIYIYVWPIICQAYDLPCHLFTV